MTSKRIRRRDFLKVTGMGLAGASLLGAAACGGGAGEQGGSDQEGKSYQAENAPTDATPLKIGAVGSLSGGGTAWGIATQRGMRVAIDQLMQDGGLKVGDKVYAPEMIMYDDQYTGQGGTSAANRLVNQDKVKFIIGPIGSPAVLGVVNVTTPEKVVVLSDGFSPSILAADQGYNFRISLTTEEFAPPIVQWLKEEYPDAKTVGMIFPNDEIGQTIVPILEEAYTDAGFDVPVSEPYERGSQDFTSELTRMNGEDVDIFELNSNAPGEAGLLVKQAKQLGFEGIMIQTGGPGIEEIISVAGAQADGFLSYDIFDPQDPLGKPFANAYREKYGGQAINAYAPIMYNATNLLFEAIRRAKSVDDTEKVRDAVRQLQGYETMFGKVRWTGEERYGIDHQLLMDFYVSRANEGDYSAIERLSP